MYSRLFTLLGATTALVLFTGKTFAGLLQNGSFESTSNPVSGNTGYYAGAAGWSVNNNSGSNGPDNVPNVVFTNLQGATAGSEATAFDADGSNGVGSLYQTFSTTPGAGYAVSFDYGQYGQRHGISNTLQVDMRGSSATSGPHQINPGATVSYDPSKSGLVSLTDVAGSLTIQDSGGYQVNNNGNYTGLYSAAPNPEFSSFNFTFTATTTTSTLVFTDESNANAAADDGMLDNVNVTPFPSLQVRPRFLPGRFSAAAARYDDASRKGES